MARRIRRLLPPTVRPRLLPTGSCRGKGSPAPENRHCPLEPFGGVFSRITSCGTLVPLGNPSTEIFVQDPNSPGGLGATASRIGVSSRLALDDFKIRRNPSWIHDVVPISLVGVVQEGGRSAEMLQSVRGGDPKRNIQKMFGREDEMKVERLVAAKDDGKAPRYSLTLRNSRSSFGKGRPRNPRPHSELRVQVRFSSNCSGRRQSNSMVTIRKPIFVARPKGSGSIAPDESRGSHNPSGMRSALVKSGAGNGTKSGDGLRPTRVLETSGSLPFR